MTTRAPPARLLALGLTGYETAWRAMRAFTDARTPRTPDELWLLEHPSVYTLGQAGRAEHVLDARGIPIVHSDRGGQVTYHGPGQAVLYTLVDLRRLRLGVRGMVAALEDAVLDLLAARGVHGARRERAPGVYVDGAKVAALGLRVRNARTYHGLALNVDLDLAPFSRIDPCGYRGLAVTSLSRLGVALDVTAAGEAVAGHLCRRLGLVLESAGAARAAS